MADELLELKERIENLSDDELLDMVRDADQYREEAVDFARNELRKRGISSGQTQTEVTKAEPPELDSRGLVCMACGGKLRSAKLVAERELSVIFDDNREERFVSVIACGQCGQITLTVDYSDEVQH